MVLIRFNLTSREKDRHLLRFTKEKAEKGNKKADKLYFCEGFFFFFWKMRQSTDGRSSRVELFTGVWEKNTNTSTHLKGLPFTPTALVR